MTDVLIIILLFIAVPILLAVSGLLGWVVQIAGEIFGFLLDGITGCFGCFGKAILIILIVLFVIALIGSIGL